ncbi:MAG: hypothetical protein WAK26_17710 [Terracidiphilus sp.]
MVGTGVTDSQWRWRITDSLQSAVRGIDAFSWAEDVNIRLRPETRIRNVIGGLREAFDNDVLHSGAAERSGGFSISGLDTLKAQSIVSQVSLETFDDPQWKFLHGELCNLQGKMGRVANSEQISPLVIR